MPTTHTLTVTSRHDHTSPADPMFVGRTEDRVVIAVDPEHADVLAKVLARFEAVATTQGWLVDETWNPDTWFHTMVDVFCEAAFIDGTQAPTVDVTTGLRP